ncbi:HisA/HisF-related TIM barrel protein [Streptomyces sp. YGL11-2]|uniref:HisA/HisF-related TIM barrel protein n=1 Tax=Streptomyces sp. YGL11-2 TaxID=3414028 RepID=UPI003CEF511D
MTYNEERDTPTAAGRRDSSKKPFTVFPSLHLLAGRVVHLVQGRIEGERVSEGPLALARAFQDQGANWLHILIPFEKSDQVDWEQIAGLVDALELKIQLATGYTVTDDASLARALATGVERLNLGTAALADRRWCARVITEHGGRIGLTLPVWCRPDGPRLAQGGLLQDGGDLWQIVEEFNRAGCTRYAVTDIGREGTMTGPNLELLQEVGARTDAMVIAAGGIASLAELRAVAALDGINGLIIGRALFTGAFTLSDALATSGHSLPGR